MGSPDVLVGLVMGTVVLLANLALQILAILLVLRVVFRRLSAEGPDGPSVRTDFGIISVVTGTLFVGYLAQAAVWAALFTYVGDQFDAYSVAFYHSLVNFTSLGYGDIVMDENWRLMGALEAANGVLMFGIGASSLLAVMNMVFSRYDKITEARKRLTEHRE